MAAKSRLREELGNSLGERIIKDFDPEADGADSSVEGSDDEEKQADLAGTEHYIDVGKSKLRQKEGVSLGPQYRGARVSRDAIDRDSDSEEADDDAGEDSESEQFDDPDTADLIKDAARVTEDAEIESDDALGDSDQEKLKDFVFRGSSKPLKPAARKRRPIAADFMGGSDEEGSAEDGASDGSDGASEENESDSSGGAGVGLFDLEAESSDGEESADEDDSGEDEDIEGLESEDDEEEEDDDDSDEELDEAEEADAKRGSSLARSSTNTRAKSDRNIQKEIVNSISDSVRRDAEKGLALRQQRQIFDGLLNIRIRLQKALVAANSLSEMETESDGSQSVAYEAAEAAALKLWSTVDDLRSNIISSTHRAGDKRKRAADDSTPSSALWDYMAENEQEVLPSRKKTLDKWSSKIGSMTISANSRLNMGGPKQSISTMLEGQLLDPERLIRRTRVPRSCAPIQAGRKVQEDESIYDDADFYQILLKELVDQRTADEASALPADSVRTVRWAAMKEAKIKKDVDRRASRGRKLRFTVHEKLQNFMAPEDRRSWEQSAIDRFFGTLFGQKLELNEADDEDEDDIEMNGISAEEAGLRLFRS